jgi:hypothetical protein
VLSPRNRELLGLLPSALLVTGGFTAIFIQTQNNSPHADTSLTLNHASSVSLTYGLLFLGLVAWRHHLVIRYRRPADPTCSRSWPSWRASDRDDLPHRTAAGAPAGAVDGARLILFAVTILALRAGASLCSSATATRSPRSRSWRPCCRACPASAGRSTAPT